MNVQLGQTIDYTTKDLESSSYTHMRIVPLSGSQTGNEGEVITFELPVQAINLSRSFLQMSFTVGAPGALKYNWIHQGILPISAMQLFTRGGQYLCNIQERLSDFTRVVMSADSHREELDNGDVSSTVYRSGVSQYYGEQGAVVADSPYFSQEVLIQSGNVNAASVEQKIKFPLSLLKHTIMGVDKSILYREVLVLKIRLADKGDVSFSSEANNDPTNNPADSGAITYSNISLYIAQERNSNIVESLNVATESDQGFSLLVPYPTLFTNIRDSTYQAVSLRLNKSHGSSLKAVKHTVFSNGTLNNRYNRDNIDGIKVSTYYVNINNNKLTEYDIDCRPAGQYLDYQEHKRRLMDTPARNRIIYQRNWFHEDRFDDYQDKKTDLKTCDTNIMSGIDLNQEIRYDFYANLTANAQQRHFSIVQGQKLLNINRNGLVLG
jgi:hypothetical protein